MTIDNHSKFNLRKLIFTYFCVILMVSGAEVCVPKKYKPYAGIADSADVFLKKYYAN